MGFSRYLQINPADLSGIGIYQPNFEALDSLLATQQQSYDVAEELANKIPNHLQEDATGIKALTEGLQQKMGDVSELFTQDIGAGNRALRNLKRDALKLWQPGGAYNQAQQNKSMWDQSVATLMNDPTITPERMDKAIANWREKGVGTFNQNEDESFDFDRLNALQPFKAPKGINYSERALAYLAKAKADEWKNAITRYNTEKGVTEVVSSSGKVMRREDLEKIVADAYLGDVEWQESADFYGEQEQVLHAFESAIRSQAFNVTEFQEGTKSTRASIKPVVTKDTWVNLLNVVDATKLGELTKDKKFSEVYDAVSKGIDDKQQRILDYEGTLAEEVIPFTEGQAKVVKKGKHYELMIPEANYEGLNAAERRTAVLERDNWEIEQRALLVQLNLDYQNSRILEDEFKDLVKTGEELGFTKEDFDKEDSEFLSDVIDNVDYYNGVEKIVIKFFSNFNPEDLNGAITKLGGNKLAGRVIKSQLSKYKATKTTSFNFVALNEVVNTETGEKYTAKEFGELAKEIRSKVSRFNKKIKETKKYLDEQTNYSRPELVYQLDAKSFFSNKGKTEVFEGLRVKAGNAIEVNSDNIEFLATGESLGNHKDYKELKKQYKQAVQNIETAGFMMDAMDGKFMMVLSSLNYDNGEKEEPLDDIQIPVDITEVSQYLRAGNIPDSETFWQEAKRTADQFKSKGYATKAVNLKGIKGVNSNIMLDFNSRDESIQARFPLGNYPALEKEFEGPIGASQASEYFKAVISSMNENGYPKSEEDLQIITKALSDARFDEYEIAQILEGLQKIYK